MEKNEAYTALSDLIYKGFLTAELDLDGKLFLFKTVNEKEFDLVKLYSGNPNRSDYATKFNTYFMIYSLFMANGKNVLLDREAQLPELYELFNDIPNTLFKKIISHLNEMRKIAYDSLKFLEGFSYTTQSRNNWRSLNGNAPCSMEFTGVPGTSKIGLNVHQESWILINKAMDSEDDYNRQFSLACMVASASNPKGARSIRNQHESDLKDSEARRKKLSREGSIEEVKRKWSPEGWAASVDTAEELVAELERQMQGVKDKHDLFMESYFKKMRDEAERKVQEAEERLKKSRENSDNVLIEGRQRILTPEEADKMMQNRAPTTKVVPSEEATTPDDRNKFYKKIGNRILTSN